MLAEKIEDEIISIISDISGFEKEEITSDTNLPDDLEIDSIKAIELTVALEKKYKISIRDSDIPEINTVEQIIDLTKRLLSQSDQT
ncbi:MAG: phosphopantetheine-binding protein [Nitrospirota bacterium]|nr:phosphopantetheine-binding protein [Nitrospirota bacterium]